MENQPTTARTWFRLTSLGRGSTQPETTQPAQAPLAALPTFPRSRLPVPTTQPPVQPLPAPQPQPQPPRTPTPPQPQPPRTPTPPQPQPPRTPTPPQPQPQRTPTPPQPQPQRTPTPPQPQPQRTPTPPQLQSQPPRTPTPPQLQPQPQPPRSPTPPPPPQPQVQTPRAPTPQPLSPIKTPGSLRSLTQQEPTATESAAVVEAQQQPARQVSLLPQSVLAPAPRAAPRTPTPPQSPKVIKTPPQSPKVIKTFSPTPPPSPRTSRSLPPAALNVNPEPEPKSMQMPAAELKSIKTASNGSRIPRSSVPLNPITETTVIDHPPPQEERKALDRRSTPAASKEDKSTVTQTSKKVEREISIINIAGENMGAYMEVGYGKPSQKQQNGQGSLPAERPRTLVEKASGKKGTKAAAAENAKPMASLVNSNVQCLNNSLLFNSSCTQQSPGVHMTLSRRKPKSSNTTANSSSA
ncbi:uncharacterized protein [Typha angustifolia]|uniref:uncharacterized protein n=1 Tax=Typha angustifolia TaxID=59011 RepID=UPI003C2B570F